LPPPPPEEPCCASDWYLKGFLGITSYDVDSIDTPLFDTANFTIFDTGFEGSGFAGLGLGYKFQRLVPLRRDIRISQPRDISCARRLPGQWFLRHRPIYRHTEILGQPGQFLLGYRLLAGHHALCRRRGFAKNWIGDYTDVNVPNLGVAFANTDSDGSFAWAVHAGLSYDVTKNFTVDLAYRFLDIGDAQSGTIHAYNNSAIAPGLEFNDITSHDVLLSARYKFGCCGGAEPMPVLFK